MCRIVFTQLSLKRCSSMSDLGEGVQNSLPCSRMGMIVTLKTLNFSVVGKSWYMRKAEELMSRAC